MSETTSTTKKRGRKGEGTIFKNSSGTWIARYSQNGFPRKEFKGRTKIEAKSKLDEWKKIVANGEAVTIKLTVGEYAVKWLSIKESQVNRGKLKASTFDRLESTYRNHILNDSIASIKLCNLCAFHIQKIIDSKQTLLSLSSINKIYLFLHSMITYAKESGDLPDSFNPFRTVELPDESALTIKTKDIEVMLPDDLKKFKEIALEKDSHGKFRYRYGPALVFMANTGLRESELLAISHNNILKKESGRLELHIDSTFSTVKNRSSSATTKTKRIVTSPKYKNSVRTIPINPEAEFCLDAMKKIYTQNSYRSDLLISTKNGRPPTERNIQLTFDRILKKAGLPHMGTHSLRHTFATELLKRTTNHAQIKEVAELLGDDYTVVVKTYLHTDSQSKFSLVDMLAG